MIAWAGIKRYKNLIDNLNLPAKSRWSFDKNALYEDQV